MTDTTPDYAGLIESRIGQEFDGECHLTEDEARAIATALRTLQERNAALERERDQLLDKLHCMCGSPIDHSAWEGHTPVSVYDYSLDQERSRAEAAEAKLALLRERLAEADRVIEPFAEYLDDGFDLDYEGRPLPDSNTLGWVYLTLGHLRDARSYRDKGRE